VYTLVAGALVVATLATPALAIAQETKEPYRPLLGSEMNQQGTWESWIYEFNNLTAKQRAEAVRRHIQLCLGSFEMTDAQRDLVKTVAAKYVNEAMYDTAAPPEQRKAMQQAMGPDIMNAQTVLGPQLTQLIFSAKPPIAVLLAVKHDPAFK
jgi:hypothetical protein